MNYVVPVSLLILVFVVRWLFPNTEGFDAPNSKVTTDQLIEASRNALKHAKDIKNASDQALQEYRQSGATIDVASFLTRERLEKDDTLKSLVSTVIMDRIEKDPDYRKMVQEMVVERALTDPVIGRIIVQKCSPPKNE